MKKIINNKIGLIFCILAFSVAIFFVGFYVGNNGGNDGISKTDEISNVTCNIKDVSGKNVENIDLSDFWAVWSTLNGKFVSSTTTKITNKEKVWGAIEGLTGSFGDPYTVFFPPKEAEVFQTSIDGNFSGVGMEIGIKDEQLTVVTPLKGTPAEKAGMLSGDKIIAINGKNTAGLAVDEAVQLIRGERGTKVKLTVTRKDVSKSFDVEIVRDTITIPTIDTKLRDDGVFVISLYNFSAVSPNLFKNALKEFVDSKSNKLILDLRGNAGGYLGAAVDMASWFLPEGKVVVTEDFGEKNKEENNIHRSKGYNIFNENLKFVILVNEGSASASEILAGALREQGVAKLVGTNTFGKGSVQELVNIGNDKASLKVTVAHWLTPNGKSISSGGLTPDYKVENTLKDKENKIDRQMNKAVEVLLQK
ncbi:MAG: Carboxy-terminal-processing protease [Parcubacteria group bacterium Athens0714_16]|nr:MAG: Carboxy-terminal-processing protease [Parcubacteria group bacterium Athens0714_16]